MLEATEVKTAMEQLPNVTEVEGLSRADEACLTDVRRVLEKHGLLKRFGVSLLHQHFRTADDEVLVETCDAESRTLTVKPIKKSAIQYTVHDTVWRFDLSEVPIPILGCRDGSHGSGCISSGSRPDNGN